MDNLSVHSFSGIKQQVFEMSDTEGEGGGEMSKTEKDQVGMLPTKCVRNCIPL